MTTEAKHELREQKSSRELSGLRLHQFPSAWNDDANLLAVNRPDNSPLGRNWISVITNEAGENICETHGATADGAVEIAQTFLTAVNNHDALVEALRELRNMFFVDAKSGANVIDGEVVHVDNKEHPWIPGARAPEAIALIDAALAAAQE